MIHTFLDLSVENQFRIISKSYNFLFGTTTTQSFTFSTSHFFSGQSRHASSSSIVLYLWLGARRPTAQSYDSSSVSWYYLGWPLHLLRGNFASKNLPCKAQQPKCCLYEMPYYVAAPVRETGDIIARTPLYARLPTYAPTKTRFFFGSWVTRFSRDPSRQSTGSYVPFLQGSHMQKQYHQRTTLRTWKPWRMQERDAE
jgi:hypothetical protein